MPAPTDPSAWIVRAEEDYALARSALRRKAPLIYGATFHAQQWSTFPQRRSPTRAIQFSKTTRVFLGFTSDSPPLQRGVRGDLFQRRPEK